jgi:hypothetical protein
MKRLDLIGKRKGKLVVVGYSHSHTQPSGQKRAVWDAVCDCGNKTQISTSNFTHGKTISCGCYFKEIIASGANKKPFGYATFNSKYLAYKIRAKNHRKKLSFTLTKEEFRILITAPCHYCGEIGYSTFKSKPTANGNFPSNGIDRLDSSVGYEYKNCVSACGICNKMKNDLSYEDFLTHIKRILTYAPEKKRVG